MATKGDTKIKCSNGLDCARQYCWPVGSTVSAETTGMTTVELNNKYYLVPGQGIGGRDEMEERPEEQKRLLLCYCNNKANKVIDSKIED